MNATARRRIDSEPIDPEFWPAVAELATSWLAQHSVAARDAVVVLPYAGLLAPARAAFARAGGWQPRIETVATLSAALGPPTSEGEGLLCGDSAIDMLSGSSLLLRQGRDWPAWQERDPRAFDGAVRRMVATALALQRAASARHPDDRVAWWAALREALPMAAGPGAVERRLARIALEWSAASDSVATDRLWSWRPAAWVALNALGGDPLVERLLESCNVPVLWLDADPPLDRAFDPVAQLEPPRCVRAESLEDEAHAAASAVLAAIDQGLAPVALIAQDRLVIRRVRALLDRQHVAIDDETGWALSTTRAGARLMALLRAAAPAAGRDTLIEAMKDQSSQAAAALEDAWRQDRTPPRFALDALAQFNDRLATFAPRRERPLLDWLAALADAAPGLLDSLASDAAGHQVMAALRLPGPGNPAWRHAAGAARCDFAAFTVWVDAALEGAHYLPAGTASAQVVITPLASAALRPFGAVVFPGCDERHLGAWSPSPTLLPEPLTREFGVMDSQLARNHELLAFAQILRAPQLTLLRRCFDDDEALAPSPLVERAWLARRRLSRPLPEECLFVPALAQTPLCPLARPAPSMSDAMPARLSASSVEALRDCPYRFYARVALGLGEANELDAGLDQSDRGRWLHAVLHRFHNQRDGSDDRMQLQAAAEAEQRSLELDPAAMLPMRAAFDLFAARYLDWLQAHEAEGWRYAGGELDRRCAAPELDGLVLDGRLDRIDHGADGGVMLIDYKTGSPDALARRVRTPLEDTQLAFYAALLTDEPHEPPPRAIYLALDERKAPQPIEHPDVARSASLLVQGLAADLDALRQGAGAPALGEGAACEHCHARGLCRRDHWTPPEAAAPLPPEGGDASGPAKPDPRRLLGGMG